MNKGIYFLLIGMIISYSSCKKKEEIKQPEAVAAVLKSVAQIPSGLSYNYSYDGQGRLAGILNTVDSTSTSIYYGGDTVIETNYDIYGGVISINTLFLNTSGLATSSYLRDAGGNIFSHKEYLYDGNNFKTSERVYDPSNNLIAHKEWGILDKEIYYYSSSDTVNLQNNAQVSYSYYYEITNSVGNQNRGQMYYGSSSQNALKTQVKTSAYTGNSRYTYQYTLDASGRITTVTAYDHLGQVVSTDTYSYN